MSETMRRTARWTLIGAVVGFAIGGTDSRAWAVLGFFLWGLTGAGLALAMSLRE